jgi:N-acetylglutamate synthase-like GNAT family acetyltransferase
MHVRGAGVDDASVIFEILSRDEGDAAVGQTRPTFDDVRQFLASHAADAFIAESERPGVAGSERTAIGVTMFHRQGDVLWLFRVAVVESMRNRGVGRSLIEAVEARARGAGTAAVFVQVPKGSHAQSFFERLGYRVDNEEREVIAGQPLVMVDLVKLVDST